MSVTPPPPQVPLSQAYIQQADEAQKSPARIAFLVARVLVYALWALVIAITILLVLGFFLQLLGANPHAGFVDWVYRSTDQIMEPFRGVFEPRPLNEDQSVFDPSMLLAAIVYLFIALLIDTTVLRWIRRSLQREDAQIADLRTRARDAATIEYYAAQQAQQAQTPGTTTTVTQTTVASPGAPTPAPPAPSPLAPLVSDPPAPPPPGQPGWPV